MVWYAHIGFLYNGVDLQISKVVVMALDNNERVMKKIQERFDLGAKKYQNQIPINTGRDYMKESLEEILDLIIYIATKLVEMDPDKDIDQGQIIVDCTGDDDDWEDPQDENW